MSDSEGESPAKGKTPLLEKYAPHLPPSSSDQAPSTGDSAKPKLSLYQRIQAAKAAVGEREEREEREGALATPLPESGDEDQEESDREKSDDEEPNQEESGQEEPDEVGVGEIADEDNSFVDSAVESEDENPQDTAQEQIAASSSPKSNVAEEAKPEQAEVISALQSPVESDDDDQDSSEQEMNEHNSNCDDHEASSEEEDKTTSKKVRTLTEMAENRVLGQLKKVVTGYQATANYCCGGSIPISSAASQPNAERPGTSKAPITSLPTVLRWDVADKPGFSQRLQFPLPSESATQDNTKSLNDLLKACSPATFGLDGEDVLDETYRKAGKLDRSQFSTDFHPHDHGIVDAINQILLPDFRSPGMKGRGEHRGVLAEQYKFNVRSKPPELFPRLTKFRSTRDRQESFELMLILPEGQHNLARLLSACPIHIKVFYNCSLKLNKPSF